MKKILSVLMVIVAMSSCTTEPEPYRNPEKELTYEQYIQFEQDTCTSMSVLYTAESNNVPTNVVFRDRNGEVHEALITTNTDLIRMPVGGLLFVMLIVFLIGLGAGAAANSY